MDHTEEVVLLTPLKQAGGADVQLEESQGSIVQKKLRESQGGPDIQEQLQDLQDNLSALGKNVTDLSHCLCSSSMSLVILGEVVLS